jgi:cytochrome c553
MAEEANRHLQMNINGRLSVLILSAVLLGATSAGAQEEAERTKLVALVNKVILDEAKHEMAITEGRDRIVLCTQCHGVDGTSKMQGVPHLAGQNPAYLLEQVEKFADGRRKNFVMQSLARSFTMEDKVNIAVYFASQRPKTEGADPALAREGARIYQNVCKMCHGDDGRGDEGYARLAGQRTDYVVLTLKRFRENSRQTVTADDMKRHNSRMEQVSQHLSDRDIDALAAHIAMLK